ncbi:hypothetical protein B0H19DRAFT_1148030 [Mycena capillaripes]|nr:hypothetical protein B0H19DRAFT_1148030 [Mycena capillaripes]
MSQTSPFDIQELVDHCVAFLHASTSDLKTCALVSRLWVYPAQSHLFRHLHTSSFLGVADGRFDTLHTSSHLVQHVRHLEVKLNTDSDIERISKIFSFSFICLEAVSITGLSEREAISFQQLLSRPTLRYVKIIGSIIDPSTYMQIWNHCSSKVQYLDVDIYSDPGMEPPGNQFAKPLTLDALRISGPGYQLTRRLCPLDSSRLRALSRIDLSVFRKLSLLRIYIPGDPGPPTMVLETLSTINPSSQIQTIGLHFRLFYRV